MTWNPVTGCDKVSPGCANCYAERLAERFRGVPGHPYEQGFDVRLWPDRIGLPKQWRKPRLVFVNSMSDLFHESVPWPFVTRCFEVMGECPQHTFQVLTKRPERVLTQTSRWMERTIHRANVWLGVSVENQRWTSRVDDLRKIPATVRFLSCEPLLGPLDLDLGGIHWVIAGGESGPGARPMKADWVRSVRDQCAASGVPFFFKQWGEHGPDGRRAGKKHTGRLLDGVLHDAYPDRGGYGGADLLHMDPDLFKATHFTGGGSE